MTVDLEKLKAVAEGAELPPTVRQAVDALLQAVQFETLGRVFIIVEVRA